MQLATAVVFVALSVSPWWTAWVGAVPVPAPVTPEVDSEVDNFESRVSLTMEEASALHSSTHRPVEPPVVKRSLMVEQDAPPADNSDAVAVLGRSPTLLQLEEGGPGGVPRLPEDNSLPALPPPQPEPHRRARWRRTVVPAMFDYSEENDSAPAVPAPSVSEGDDTSSLE